MRVGVMLPQFSADPVRTLVAAREAEALGYDTVAVFDHLLPPGGDPDRPVLEAFSTLAAVAVETSSVRLLTLVARAGLRPPVMTAALVRTVSLLAPERFVFGVGSGDATSAVEDALIGAPRLSQTERRAQVEATVLAVRAKVPGQPVWVGGKGRAMRRLAVSLADAWNAWAATPAEITAGKADIGELPVTWGGQIVLAATAEEATQRAAEWTKDRDPVRDRVIAGDAASVAAQLRALGDAGVEEIVLSFVGGGGALQRRSFAQDVRPLL